jgi:hypothetical protein
MLGDGHVRFGGRSAETERPKGRHRAAGRPHNLTPRQQLKLAHIQKINQRLYRDRGRDRRCREVVRIVVELRRRSRRVDGQTVAGWATSTRSGFGWATRMA